ncbi:MAG TPA: RraA family protein [Hyphomicrobiales bacterium]|nr:RraA family protein [Hyphomicrobiales bacterium]
MNPRSTDNNVERVARLDTATLSDALDKLRISGQCLGIKPRDHDFRLAGRAYTILYGPLDAEKAGTVGDFIDKLDAGTVVVIDNGGREDATVWGDILTYLAHKKGLAGTVIDGACRDVHLCLSLGYPIYSRSYSMRTGKDRVQVDAEQVPVNIGDARVQPGDLIRGDADGVVCIPRSREEEVLAVAEQIDAAETQIRAMLEAGRTIGEARAAMRYHSLQTPEK